MNRFASAALALVAVPALACRRSPDRSAQAAEMGELIGRAAAVGNDCFVDYLAQAGARALEFRFSVKDRAFVYKDARVEPSSVPRDRVAAAARCLQDRLARERPDHPDLDELTVRVDAKPR